MLCTAHHLCQTLAITALPGAEQHSEIWSSVFQIHLTIQGNRKASDFSLCQWLLTQKKKAYLSLMEAYSPVHRKWLYYTKSFPLLQSIQQECDDLPHMRHDYRVTVIWKMLQEAVFGISNFSARQFHLEWNSALLLWKQVRGPWSLSAARYSAGTLFPSSYWRRPLVEFCGCSSRPYGRHPPVISICHSASPIFWCDGCSSVPS